MISPAPLAVMEQARQQVKAALRLCERDGSALVSVPLNPEECRALLSMSAPDSDAVAPALEIRRRLNPPGRGFQFGKIISATEVDTLARAILKDDGL